MPLVARDTRYRLFEQHWSVGYCALPWRRTFYVLSNGYVFVRWECSSERCYCSHCHYDHATWFSTCEICDTTVGLMNVCEGTWCELHNPFAR